MKLCEQIIISGNINFTIHVIYVFKHQTIVVALIVTCLRECRRLNEELKLTLSIK